MAKETMERRKIRRIGVDLPANLQILFPEVSFTPLVLKGFARDISREGVRIKVANLTTGDYSRIIRGPRLCRVICVFPAQDAPTRLFGKIINFEIRGKVSEGACVLGVHLGENDKEDLQRLNQFLESLPEI